MTLPRKQTVESWIFNTATVAAGIVLAFSVFNGYSFLPAIFRTMTAFFLIFLLGKGLLGLWEKISPPPPKNEPHYGSTIDVILGNFNAKGIGTSTLFPGSEDDEEEAQDLTVEYKRPIPGQINKDIKSGLQDAGAKAEIVRKMGWEEDH